MKSFLRSWLTSFSSLVAFGLLASPNAHALTWSGGNGVWNNTLMNWDGNTQKWTDNQTAVFNNSIGGTVTIGDNLRIGAIQFVSPAGVYNISNGPFTLDFNGAGISNTSANVQVIGSSGIINFNNSSSAGVSTITLSNSGGVNFNNTSTAGGANLSINSGQITFQGSSTAATSTINSSGILEFLGTSSGGSAVVSNGGTLDISGHTGTVTLASLNNGSGGSAGAVITGANKLQVGSLTLAPFSGNLLDFTLFTAGTSGEIIVGGPFVGAGTGQVAINISTGAPLLTSSVYDLIDWTAGSASDVQLTDFVLTQPTAYAAQGYTLRIDPSTGKKLQLVQAVPEGGNTLLLLGCAVGCMIFGQRRTASI